MTKYLTEVTSDVLIDNAYDVYSQKRQGIIPILNGVNFDAAFKLGYCQKNIRQLIEATVWGEQWRWHEASCCAGNTCHKIKQSGYESLRWAQAEPGDLIYTMGGKKCKICKNGVGHVMLYVGDDEDSKMMFQNTSYEKRALDIIPIRQSQINSISGIFRLFPQKEEKTIKIIELNTNNILATISGDYTFIADHLQDQGKIYLKKN